MIEVDLTTDARELNIRLSKICGFNYDTLSPYGIRVWKHQPEERPWIIEQWDPAGNRTCAELALREFVRNIPWGYLSLYETWNAWNGKEGYTYKLSVSYPRDEQYVPCVSTHKEAHVARAICSVICAAYTKLGEQK